MASAVLPDRIGSDLVGYDREKSLNRIFSAVLRRRLRVGSLGRARSRGRACQPKLLLKRFFSRLSLADDDGEETVSTAPSFKISADEDSTPI